ELQAAAEAVPADRTLGEGIEAALQASRVVATAGIELHHGGDLRWLAAIGEVAGVAEVRDAVATFIRAVLQPAVAAGPDQRAVRGLARVRLIAPEDARGADRQKQHGGGEQVP